MTAPIDLRHERRERAGASTFEIETEPEADGYIKVTFTSAGESHVYSMSTDVAASFILALAQATHLAEEMVRRRGAR